MTKKQLPEGKPVVQVATFEHAFAFETRRCTWSSCVGTAVESVKGRDIRLWIERERRVFNEEGWNRGFGFFVSPNPENLGILPASPSNRDPEGKQAIVRIDTPTGEPLEFIVDIAHLPEGVTIGGRKKFEVFLGIPERGPNAITQIADAWQMRNEFLRAGTQKKTERSRRIRGGLRPSRASRALLRFLNKWGIWGSISPTGDESFSRDLRPVWESHLLDQLTFLSPTSLKEAETAQPDPIFIFPNELIAFQNEFSQGGCRPAPEWVTKLKLPPNEKEPLLQDVWYTHIFRSCRGCIEGTITIDKGRKINLEKCGLESCLNLYRGKPGIRGYCCRAHNELASKHRNRNRSKDSAETAQSQYAPADRVPAARRHKPDSAAPAKSQDRPAPPRPE